MTRRLEVWGSKGAATGFELRVGDQRFPFGFDEARRLVEAWPGQLARRPGCRQAANGDRLEVTLSGRTVALTAGEARRLARLPSQLRWLLDLADGLTDDRRQLNEPEGAT